MRPHRKPVIRARDPEFLMFYICMVTITGTCLLFLGLAAFFISDPTAPQSDIISLAKYIVTIGVGSIFTHVGANIRFKHSPQPPKSE